MRKPKILINYQLVKFTGKSGIPLLIESLTKELKINSEIELKIFYMPLPVEKNGEYDYKNFFNKVAYTFYRKLKSIIMSLVFYFGDYDFYIETDYFYECLKKPKKTKIMNIIYDLGLIKYDDINTKRFTKRFREKLPSSIENSDIVLTISKTTKEEVKEYINTNSISHKRIEYFYCDTVIPECSESNALDRFKIEGDYILFLGNIEPRKNPINMVKGFELYLRRYNKDLKLVIAGKKAWLYEELMSYISNNKLENNIIFTGYISDADKFQLLKNAKLFIFLSIYEGFGIPPLEALKLGTPVLLSNIPVFLELYSELATFTDGTDIIDIADKIDIGLKNPIIPDSELLKKFDWRLSSDKICQIITEEFNKND